MMFDLPMFTLIHVVISVLGIITGLVVVGGLLAGTRLDGWTELFLATTTLTSVTGFGFPFTKVLPSHIVGAISIVERRARRQQHLRLGPGPPGQAQSRSHPDAGALRRLRGLLRCRRDGGPPARRPPPHPLPRADQSRRYSRDD